MPPSKHPGRRHQQGQSVVEFAIVFPVVMLLLVAIADFGRLYTSAVAVEAAGREAADFGAFDASYWETTQIPQPNYVTTVNEMQRRACVAAAGSHLEGYETTDPANNTTCTNPAFSCTLERNGATTDCLNSGGFPGGVNCSDPATDPPCTVHVQMTYMFRTLLALPALPATIQLIRDSRFRISCLSAAGDPRCP